MKLRISITLFLLSALLTACGKSHEAHQGSMAAEPSKAKYPGKLIVHKQASCGCCTSWANYMNRNGFDVEIVEERNMDQIRLRYAVPEKLKSCHTAVYGNLVIEGHVPVEDVVSIISTPSLQTRLIAVPQMPIGSPGMESGGRIDPYTSIIQNRRGAIEKFRHHGG